MTNEKKLVRPQEGRKLAGVCQGIANYLGIDVTVVRLLLVLAIIFCGSGILAYIIAWIVMPDEPKQLPR